MSLAGKLGESMIWLRRSSAMRLALVLSLIFALGMVVAVFVALWLGSDALERRVDNALMALAGAASLDDERGDSFGVILRTPDDLRDLPRPFGRNVGGGARTIELERDFQQADTWRVLVTTDREGEPIFVAVPLDDSEDALELLAGILWATVVAVIALALAVGVVAGFLAQKRLKRIDTTLGALASGDLTARTGLTRSRDDLDDMARQLDVTAGELERLVAQTRHLSASLAHDLRTPLARLRSRLEALPDGEARGEALEEAERLSGIFDTIMRVARIEAAQGTNGFEDVDLGVLLTDLGETFGPVIEDAGKTVELESDEPTTVSADRQMLVQAMANLIQNAVRHGGSNITLVARGHSIGVCDDGAGVAPEQYSEIVKPMVRLDEARQSQGTGLGLALVRAVADRHGATLDLSRHTPSGLAVFLKFADL